MKLLLLADEESKYLYDYYQPGRLKEYDLIISCGDLKANYLSFIVTMARAPVLYVHGNHDVTFDRKPPEGCDCIEDKLVTVNGLRILGLGGSRVYSGGPHQYTDAAMEKRIRKLRRKIKKAGGVDILVTHAPARGVGDGDDYAHRGFDAFLPFLEEYKPKYMIHGHVHMSYGVDIPRVRQYGETTVINACERYVLELPDPAEEVK